MAFKEQFVPGLHVIARWSSVNPQCPRILIPCLLWKNTSRSASQTQWMALQTCGPHLCRAVVCITVWKGEQRQWSSEGIPFYFYITGCNNNLNVEVSGLTLPL